MNTMNTLFKEKMLQLATPHLTNVEGRVAKDVKQRI